MHAMFAKKPGIAVLVSRKPGFCVPVLIFVAALQSAPGRAAEDEPAAAEVLSQQRLRIVFDEPCFGVAPGQAVVCYQGDRVLGGGWIE